MNAIETMGDLFLLYGIRFGFAVIFVFSPVLLLGAILRILQFYLGVPLLVLLATIFYYAFYLAGLFFIWCLSIFFLQMVRFKLQLTKTSESRAILQKFSFLSLILVIVIFLLAGVALVTFMLNKTSITSAVVKEVLTESVFLLSAFFFSYSISVSKGEKMDSGSRDQEKSTNLEKLHEQLTTEPHH